jgi:hypothetical protein
MLKRFNSLLLAVLLFVGLGTTLFLHPRSASAAQITNRSLTLQAGTDPITNAGSRAGATGVKHAYAFTLPSAGNVGSIEFRYCTLPNGPSAVCTTPAGLSTTSATLDASGGGATFTSVVNTTNGAPYITRTAASITANTAVTVTLGNITNPDGSSCGLTIQDNCTFFVWISSFASEDATGSATDTGTVTAATAQQITLTGTMPESLVFCTGGTITTTAGVPDCGTATSGAISFDKLFSPTDTATASSQMAASTNAGAGYIITVNGPTLTSGGNTITAMGTSGAGAHGVSQFGTNLKANTTTTSNPAVGAEVAPASNGTNYRGEAVGGYKTVDNFKYVSGDTVADSGTEVSNAGGTDAQIFTNSYIVNVPGSQPAGTYTTTLTYICTASF